jgi:hypothetical protein
LSNLPKIRRLSLSRFILCVINGDHYHQELPLLSFRCFCP